MKWLLPALAVLSISARAETLTLNPPPDDGTQAIPYAGFGLLDQFWHVPTDSDVNVTIVWNNSLVMSDRPNMYCALRFTGDVANNVVMPCYTVNPDGTSTLNGSWVILSGSQFHVTTRGSCSGRGCNPYKTHYYFNGGTLERP